MTWRNRKIWSRKKRRSTEVKSGRRSPDYQRRDFYISERRAHDWRIIERRAFHELARRGQLTCGPYESERKRGYLLPSPVGVDNAAVDLEHRGRGAVTVKYYWSTRAMKYVGPGSGYYPDAQADMARQASGFHRVDDLEMMAD